MVHVATAPGRGPDLDIQGGSDAQGKGGGRYFSPICEQDPMPHRKNRDARIKGIQESISRIEAGGEGTA